MTSFASVHKNQLIKSRNNFINTSEFRSPTFVFYAFW